MTDVAERLVGMLGPARANLDGAGRGHGAVTPQMVAAGLAKCSNPIGAALLQAKVTGDFRYVELEQALHAELLPRAFREGWRVHRPRTLEGTVRQLLRLALANFLAPEQCPRCGGRLTVHDRSTRQDKDCPRCGGAGTIDLTAKEMASELGLTSPAWKKRWASRYTNVQAWLQDLYGTAEGDLTRALR